MMNSFIAFIVLPTPILGLFLVANDALYKLQRRDRKGAETDADRAELLLFTNIRVLVRRTNQSGQRVDLLLLGFDL